MGAVRKAGSHVEEPNMRLIVLSLVASAFLLTGGAAPVRADSEAAALLEKYKAFMGWTLGDGSVNSIRIKGQIADQSRFDEICEPGRFAQYNVGIQSGRPFLVGGSAGLAWVSHAGDARDLPEVVGQDAFTQYLLVCNAFASYPATIISSVAPSGTNSRAGYALVGIAIPKEPAVILSINKDTGQITSVVIDGIASYEPADLKNIDDKRRIYTRWKRISDNETADLVIKSLQWGMNVDPAIFARNALDTPPPADSTAVVNF